MYTTVNWKKQKIARFRDEYFKIIPRARVDMSQQVANDARSTVLAVKTSYIQQEQEE